MPIETVLVDSIQKISPNFIASYESANITGLAVGANIPTISDGSGHGNTFLKDGGNFSTYFIDALGYPCVRHATNAQWKSTQNFAPSQNFTYCIVINADVKANGANPFTLLNNDSLSFSGLNALYFSINPSIGGWDVPDSVLTLNKAHVILMRRTNTYIEAYIDGVQVLKKNFTGILNTPLAFLYMGAGGNFRGNWYQYHAINEYLNDSKASQLMRYCAFKTGVKI